MSKLLGRIQDDLKTSMRERNAPRTGALRLVVNDLKNAGIEKKSREGADTAVDSPAMLLTDDEIVKLLQSGVKRRKESAEQYRDGGRPELAEREEGEIEVLSAYLPAALSAEDLAMLVDAAVAESGASTPAEMGAVMKVLMPKVAGRADGKEVSAAVRQALA